MIKADAHCDFCDSSNVPLEEYPIRRFFPKDEKTKNLCALCASSPAGNAYEYPEQYQGEINTLRTLCFVGNEILKAIRAASSKP